MYWPVSKNPITPTSPTARWNQRIYRPLQQTPGVRRATPGCGIQPLRGQPCRDESLARAPLQSRRFGLVACASGVSSRSLLAADQVGERLAQDRRRVRADAVDLDVLRLLQAVAERRLLVPLPLRDDVADLVVGQADQHPVLRLQLRVDRRLLRRV